MITCKQLEVLIDELLNGSHGQSERRYLGELLTDVILEYPEEEQADVAVSVLRELVSQVEAVIQTIEATNPPDISAHNQSMPITLPDQIKHTLGLVEAKNTLPTKKTSPWEHLQSDDEYADYVAYLPDSNDIGVLLMLSFNKEDQTASIHIRVNDIYGEDYADVSNSIAVNWDAAVRMIGYNAR